jgi:hypothetical protein
METSIVTGIEPYTGDETYTVKYRKAGEKHWTYLPGYTKNVDVAKERIKALVARG